MKKYKLIAAAGGILALLVLGGAIFLEKSGLLPERPKSAEDFGIKTLESSSDADGDGIDDYADIMLGARLDAENKPRYDGAYQAGGYPPDDVGVCTDVIWRAFKNAGYDLRAMVDKDIALCPADYPSAVPADSNIDFRRVPNLNVFFSKYAQSLTTDIYDIAQWQPGDIVVFENIDHIGIVSEHRSSNGVSWLIHNSGQPQREEPCLEDAVIAAHYRFDAALVPPEIIVLWDE